ncbi:MAG: protein-disulfide reductase DsbD family protein [Leptospiraceae bacterium]|nr:protein-disulfide reductase DsbD family protein [Leptospiraceae bacterium]MDW7976411.1 hypothetical protein [Leptospiraceae bacterium]
MRKDLTSILLFLFAFFIQACKPKEETKPTGIPEPKIIVQTSQNQIKFSIEIPKDHHAYLDSGKENSLIPIQFDWKDMIQNQILPKEPRMIAKPLGVYDKEYEATVLRGQGEFLFELPEGVSENIKGQKVYIKIQICNEVTGICYRPKIYPVAL